MLLEEENNMKTNKDYDDTIDNIYKVREEIAKEIKGMTWQEEKEYYAKKASKIKKELEDYKNKVKLEQDILDYYKSTYGSSFEENINSDLKKVIEFRKSL